MTFLRALVRIPRDSGIPADDVMNTLYFQSDEDVAATVLSAHGKLEAFYQAIDGSVFSNQITNTATVTYYDLEDVAPRAPVATEEIALTPDTSIGFPAEVAICLSFQAAQTSGLSQLRRRGRIYLGPVSQDAGTAISGDLEVADSVRVTIATAAEAMAGGAPATEAVWHVFSPTTAGAEPWSSGDLDNAFSLVANGWIDNAFDIQRRRGTRASERTTWS